MANNLFTAAPVFPTIDEARWREAALASLKGGRFEDRLVARTYDGLTIEPLYTKNQSVAGAASLLRSAPHCARPWCIAQRLDLADPQEANAQALDDLEGGANALVIALGGAGVAIETASDVDRLLDGIHLDYIRLTLEADNPANSKLFVDAFQRLGIDLAMIDFCPGFSPFSDMARNGLDIGDEAPFSIQLANIHGFYQNHGHRGPLFLLDARPVAEALGSEGQELASILSQAVAYFRGFETAGIDLNLTPLRLAAKLTLDSDQFLSIAKLRALHLLWARLLEEIGLAPTLLDIRCETSWRMLSGRDPWVNVLRGTTACFAGAVGGATEIALHPFSSALGRPDGLARRIARNTQTILAEESNLTRVHDPAGGSFFVESLTERLAERAWGIFQDIERQGGFAQALRLGHLQHEIAVVREKRLQSLAQRRDKLTGVSEYPDIFEASVAVGASWGEQTKASGTINPLPRLRLSEGFEALRARAEATKFRPTLFLANLGSPADTIARATFAKNAFEVGGIATLNNDGFSDIAHLIDAFKASGTPLACLCSSDGVYAETGAAAASALKAAGAKLVVLAGHPREGRQAFQQAGVDCFIYAGMDMIAVLTDIHQRIGL